MLNTNKNCKYELTDELSDNVRLKKNLKTPWGYSLVPILLIKVERLLILARNY